MFQTKLQMRLESGEPKCANCRHWDMNGQPVGVAWGPCALTGMQVTDGITVADHRRFTTDLQVCSKWEMKA